MTDTLRLLRELIALPSVNPAFLPDCPEFTGEKRMADYLAALAGKAGLEVELRPVFPGRCNLLVRLGPPQKARGRILLAPHLDTVGGGEIPGKLFTPRLRQGKLYGRGACDTKASVAVFLTALCELASSPRRPAATELFFAGFVDEEHGQAGSRALVKNGFKADLAIVGEPTLLRVVTAHKGDLWLKLETQGQAAHSSRPELGRNAVHAMARIVDLIETRYARQLRRRRHPVLGQATVSVGTIAGGTQPNIVPDRCGITVDRRTLPGETDEEVRREIAALLRQNGLNATLSDWKMHPARPLETDVRHPLVQQLFAVAGQRKPAGVDYFSDAGVLANGGTPSVLFGPGDIAQAHTADEWIEVNQLERAKTAVLKFLRGLP